MAVKVVNINVDASIYNTIDIADVDAAYGNLLFQALSDGANVFNKSTASSDGVIVTGLTKYTVFIPIQDAQLLRGVSCNYILYRIVMTAPDGINASLRTLQEVAHGTMTVSNLIGEISTEINYTNSDGQKFITQNYTALPTDDTIFVTAAAEETITLPDNTLMVGKRIRIKRLSASVANVVIENHAGDTITT